MGAGGRPRGGAATGVGLLATRNEGREREATFGRRKKKNADVWTHRLVVDIGGDIEYG